MTDPADLSATEARRLIGTKRLSPVELVDACIARTEARDGPINAMVARDFDRARTAAKAAEAAVVSGAPLGALHGLPVGVKDLTETAGLRTTWGSELFRDHVPVRDDPVVAAIRAAGGIILAKTNTPEFGAGAVTRNAVYGDTGNPFDPAKTSSGSSGGSAAALAAGMVTLATGSDHGGSLRTPAAYCGVVGVRPSPGTVPTDKAMRGWSPLSVEGPMARTVEDAALLLSVMAGADAIDPLGRGLSADDLFPLPPVDPSTLRIGVSEDLGFFPVDPIVRAAFADRVAALRGIARSVAIVVPPLGDPHATFEALRGAAFLASHRERLERTPDKVGPRIRENMETARLLSAVDVIEAEKAQARIFRAFRAMFREIDLFVCPTVAVPPFEKTRPYVDEIAGRRMRTYIEWVGLTWGITLTASPVVALPMGLDGTGMPFGLQIVGPAGHDRFVMAAAAAIEAAFAREPSLARPVPPS